MFKFLNCTLMLNIFIFLTIILVTRYGMERSVERQLLTNNKTSFLFINDISVDNAKVLKGEK